MWNPERIESARLDAEASSLTAQRQQEREKIEPLFNAFMESAYWNIQAYTGDAEPRPQFTHWDMLMSFIYGAREAGHLYADTEAKIKELETANRKLHEALGEKWYRYCPQDNPNYCADPRLVIEAMREIERLREALDGIITVAKIICNEFPVGTASLYGWVLIGEQALKEASHE